MSLTGHCILKKQKRYINWSFFIVFFVTDDNLVTYICPTATAATILWPRWTLSWTTWVSQYQKGETNLDLLEQEIVSGSGIFWAICKSAPRPRQITMPESHHSVFYRLDALPAAQPTASKQQHQSTERCP